MTNKLGRFARVEFILRTKKLHIVKSQYIHGECTVEKEEESPPQVDIVVGRTNFRRSGSRGAILLRQIFVVDIAD